MAKRAADDRLHLRTGHASRSQNARMIAGEINDRTLEPDVAPPTVQNHHRALADLRIDRVS